MVLISTHIEVHANHRDSDRKVREQIKSLTQEDSVLKYLSVVKDSLSTSPAGPKPSRTLKEKMKSKNEAAEILKMLVPDIAASVVGRANATAAGRRLFAAFNNQRLKYVSQFSLAVLYDTNKRVHAVRPSCLLS